MKTLVIIPTWNEKANIKALVPAILGIVSDVDILVVDDRSPDGTADIVREMQKVHTQVHLLVGNGKEGLGKAYIRGFKEALAHSELERIVMMDADFSHDPEYLPEMIRAVGKADVVVGSRYIMGGNVKGWDFWRVMLSKGGNIYCRMLLHAPMSDYTGGFYVIRTSILRQLHFETFGSSGYAFQIELKYFLWKLGARFHEFPISFKNRREGESKISSHIVLEGLLAPWKILFKK